MLAGALAKFRSKCPVIKQESKVKVTTRTGGSYEFKYADLATISSKVSPILSEYGLAVSQLVEEPGVVTTMLMHESGQFITTRSVMPVDNINDKQAIGGVVTYLRRYALAAILGIVSDEDDDANYARSRAEEAPSKKATPAKAAGPAKAKATEPEPSTALKLTADIKKAMIKAIEDGRIDDVEKRLAMYDMSLGDRTELKTLIANARAKGNVTVQQTAQDA